MGRRKTAIGYNKMLNCYHFFDTKEEAEAFARRNRWRKYNISSNQAGTCWTLYHKAIV